jgi:putative Holliday junction resolvase
MRVLGVDSGRRRIGLAVSDPSATLARAWQTIEAAGSPAASADRIATLVAAEDARTLGDFELGAIVVGLPRRLSGADTHGTAGARALAESLATRTGLAVHLQDERLTSHEAEAALAHREPDWRLRKKLIDAAAAAIVLQDYLDQLHDRTATAEVGDAGRERG